MNLNCCLNDIKFKLAKGVVCMTHESSKSQLNFSKINNLIWYITMLTNADDKGLLIPKLPFRTKTFLQTEIC